MKPFESLTIQKQIKRQLDQIGHVVGQQMFELEKVRKLHEAKDLTDNQAREAYKKIRYDAWIIITSLLKRVWTGKDIMGPIDEQLKKNLTGLNPFADNYSFTRVGHWLDGIALVVEETQKFKKETWSTDADAIEQLWTLIRVI